jgi:hypothetical protein
MMAVSPSHSPLPCSGAKELSICKIGKGFRSNWAVGGPKRKYEKGAMYRIPQKLSA